jgi:hypothetical protein
MAHTRWWRAAAAAGLTVFFAACGYIGEPMPPLLNIPKPVTDLRAIEHGDRIVVTFSPPRLTTEGVALKRLGRLELRAGPGPEGAFHPDAWASAAKVWQIPADPQQGRFEIPAGDWIGKEIILGIKAFGTNQRDAGWSNLVALAVVPPLARPADLRAAAVPQGVRLSWTGQAPSYRIFRRGPGEQSPLEIATTDKPEWVDASTEYGKTYQYSVQAFRSAGHSSAESEISPPVEIVPKDTFPPAVPAGLKAIAGSQTIELAWDRNPESDLAGYRVYRAEGNGAWTRVAAAVTSPAYSDRKIESGKRYRYAVTAYDRLDNESPRSEPVEVTAP